VDRRHERVELDSVPEQTTTAAPLVANNSAVTRPIPRPPR
jgi:hypothetical protein